MSLPVYDFKKTMFSLIRCRDFNVYSGYGALLYPDPIPTP